MFYNLITKRKMPYRKRSTEIFFTLFIIIISLGIVSTLWTIGLNVDLIFYYNLDETSGTEAEESVSGVIDITGLTDNWTTGILGNGYWFPGVGDVDTGINLSQFGTNFTMNFWLNRTGTMDVGARIFDSDPDLLIRVNRENNIDVRFNGTETPGVDTILVLGRWYMITITRNDSGVAVWLNGTLNQTAELSEDFFIGQNFCFGSGGTACGVETRVDNLIIDEIGFWNRTLNTTELLELYNNTEGITRLPNNSQVILNTPTNNTIALSSNQTFVATITQSVRIDTIANATLYIYYSNGSLFNDTIIQNLSGVTNTTNLNLTNLPLDTFVWNVFGCWNNTDASIECVFAPGNFTLTTGFSINNVSFNTPVSEGSQQIFSLNLTYDLLTHNLEPRFHYNNTVFNPSISVIAGDTILSNQFAIPGLLSNANLTLFWDLDFTNIDTSNVFSFNTTENNQSVLILNIDDCSVFTNEILNFTMVDEETQIQLSGSVATNDSTDMDIAVNIFDSLRESLILEISNNFTVNPVRICLESGLLNDSDYSMDVIVNYEVDGLYASEFYNIVNVSLNGNYTARGITLFDLNISDSTPFLLTFTGENYLPEGDVLVNVNRQYIEENVFKTVELPITDDNGRTILNLVRNDVIYNLRMIKNGQLIGNFERIRAFCEDPLLQNCQITLAATPTIDEFTYDSTTDLIYTALPTYDPNASTVTFDFIIASGLSKTVNLNVTRSDIFGNRTICENSLTSASGTLICSIDPGITDTRLITGVSVDEITVILSSIRVNVSDLGTVGYVAWFILTLILIFIFGDTKSGVLISLLVSYIGAAILGINRATILGISSAGIWIIVITVLGLWRLNRDKIQ